MAKPKTQDIDAPVFLDYRGVSGPSQEFAHDGEYVISHPTGGDPLSLAPGLNIVDGATWPVFASTDSAKRRLAGEHIRVTDAELTHYRNPAAWRSLIERTQSGDALEHLQRIELAKPQAGPVAERRNPAIVELLEKQIALAVRRPTVNLAGMHSLAAQQARIAGVKLQAERAKDELRRAV